MAYAVYEKGMRISKAHSTKLAAIMEAFSLNFSNSLNRIVVCHIHNSNVTCVNSFGGFTVEKVGYTKTLDPV